MGSALSLHHMGDPKEVTGRTQVHSSLGFHGCSVFSSLVSAAVREFKTLESAALCIFKATSLQLEADTVEIQAPRGRDGEYAASSLQNFHSKN